ncbi:uncharacterized protein [Trachinotus anak]|uniref:uncharacterized protein isoform X3 n=1 Tax=Trachinotus anak TaxID=443729 RepID=UPI0039F1F5CE
MRVNIYSCLLAFALGCNVTAEILQTVAEERQQFSLPCPGPVEGTVTWSRERDGDKVDLITVDGDREIKHNDPDRRYSLQADKTLVVVRAALSDSGRFFCNNEPAVDLTVIPSGTVKQRAAERSSVTLRCPPGVSDGPTWSRETAGKQERIREGVSTVDKTLTMTEVEPGDSGLYRCDGKPAVYLRVVQRDRASSSLWHLPVRMLLGFLYLITMIIITVVTWRKAAQRQNQNLRPLAAETENHL